MAENIELQVSLGLQQAISQAESLRRILQQSVKPDSSAYRAIEGMLNKATQQAEMFKQTMGESLKTSSGTKTFTNKIQQTVNLLGVAAERLSSVKGKDLIFEDSDLQRIQSLQTQVQQIEEHIKELRKNKIGNFFADSSVSEFKQIQELAERMHIDISKMTFSDLQNAISKELRNANNSIDQTKEKIQQLDNVLKNTNINDINKLTQGLNSKMAGNTIEVFKADNLTEANKRLQDFYKNFSAYQGRIKSKINEGDPISKVLETESKAINSNLSRQIAELNNYKKELEEAYNTLQGISGHKKGQGYDYKRQVFSQQNIQDLLRSIGFDEVLSETGDPAGIIARARDVIFNAFGQVGKDQNTVIKLRSDMLETLKDVFNGLDTQTVVGDAKNLKQIIADSLMGDGVNLKNNTIAQAFDSIKNKADAAQVVNTFVAALQQYIVTAQQSRDASIQSGAEQEAYAQKLAQGSTIVAQAMQAQDAEIDIQRMNMAQLRDLIAEVVAEREHEQTSMVKDNDTLNQGTHAYENLTNALKNFNAEQIKSEARAATVGNIRTAIVNWMGFNQVMQLTKRAVSEAINHIKQLDTTMNGIAIVTNMTTADLWKQVDAYSDMAQNFGVTIQGAYEVSKIYYQAGYETSEVLTLTNETLKLAKISGLDYATTTDYMMTAMRGFKLEMEDASRVVDVYSNLAANTAVSQQELAEAMTRTASSMESVGATFEETSAMIATMVAVTRESANNIGSAMKSIASRYGELTKDPTALFDAEGEAMSFNKVDEALRSVGITLQTTDHQFRDFTDVILELADKWDTLDSAAQRYVATQFAGNRQQSRFLALVGNVDLLRQNIANAENSEDVGTLQALKALDSLESKLNQVQVAYQQFYTTIGIENVWKALLDSTTEVIDTLNGLPKLFGTVPVNAAAMVYSVITLVKTVVLNGFSSLASQVLERLKANGQQLVQISYENGKEAGKKTVQGYDEETQNLGKQAVNNLQKNFNLNKLTSGLSVIGSLSVTLGSLIDKGNQFGRIISGISTGIGGLGQTASGLIRIFSGTDILGGIIATVSGVLNIINGVSIGIESTQERLKRLSKEAEELNNIAKQEKANYNILQRSLSKVEELKEKRYESAEAAEEYQSAVDDLINTFPELIAGFNASGDVILDTVNAEQILEQARRKSAQAALDAAEADLKAKEEAYNQSQKDIALFSPVDYTTELNLNRESRLQKLQDELRKYVNDALEENYSQGADIQMMANGLTSALNLDEFFNAIENTLNSEQLSESESPLPQYLQNYKEKLQELYNQQVPELNDEQAVKAAQINKLIQEYDSGEQTSESINNLITEVYELIDSDTTLSNYFSDLLSYFNLYNENIQTGLENRAALDSAAKLLASQWQGNQLLNNRQYDYLKEESEFATILNKEFASQVNTYKDYTENQSKWLEDMKSVNNFWTSLNNDSKKLFNSMFQDNYNYSGLDIIQSSDFIGMDEELQNKVLNYYQQSIQSIRNRLINQYKEANISYSSNFTKQYTSELIDVDTEAEANYLSNTFQQYQTLYNNGYIQYAEMFGNSMLNLYNQIEQLNPTLRAAILEVIQQYGITTQNGIEKIKEFIISDKNYAELNTEELNVILKTIIPNVQLGLQTAISSLIENWSDTSKELTKALSGGLELKEVDALITKANSLGLTLDINKDFINAGDKLILTSEAFASYQQALTNETEKTYKDYQQRLEQAKNIFGKGYSGEALNEDERNVLQSIGFDVNSYVNVLGQLTGDWVNAGQEAMSNTELLLSNLVAYLEIANQQLMQSSQWAKGDYSTIGGSEVIKTIASHQAQLSLDREFDQNMISAAKYFNSAYSSFLADALEKGFKNINPKDYEGLLDENINWTGSYTKLIEDYGNYTGKTISEINELMVQAIEKDKKPEQQVKELMKDISFTGDGIAYASLETIQKIADILQQDVRNMFDPQSFDELLGGYRITNFDFSGIEGAQTLVADSIQKFFEDIANLISNGLAGKLSNQDVDNLSKQMERYGITVTDSMFTRTAEGMKLTADAATTLYSRLREIDSLGASLVFDDLADSFQQAGEECENISSTLAAIARLEADLQKPENANNQLLRDRLALYKDIAAAQTSDPNQFKFMDRDLPAGMQGPENYWNAVGKAYDAMNDAKSTGYMEIQDYYNIINEMSNLMEMSGGQLEWMGMNFENAAEMSAKLIEQGMSALTNIDGKGVKISMAKLGADFGIGVDDMSKGFDDGIKEMARAQIKMLDAQIALLEAVVAMEGLGDIDTDGIEGFSFGDIFKQDEDGVYTFTEDYQKWADGILEAAKKNEDLNKALEGVSFNDTTLKNMLADGASMAKMSKKEAEQYFAAMNSLYLMFQSGDYDLEDLLPSIQRVAAASHFEGEIKVGDDKILISHGYVLEMNKDGNYVSAGGKEFKNAKDASAYLALTELGIEEDQIIEQQVGKTEAITYSSTMTLGKTTITVRSSSDGLEYFTPDGNGPYKSVDALIAAEVKRARESGNFDEGMSDQEIISELGYNYTIHPTITADTDKLELSKTQVSNLVGKTLTELKEEFGKGEHEEEFVLKYGFTLTGNETEADLDNLKELQGIESKNVELTLSVNAGDDEEIVNLLNTTPATKEVTLTVTDIDYGGLNNDPTNPNPNTPKINLSDTTNGLESIRSIINEITAIDWTNFNNLSDILTTIITQVEKIATAVQTFANQTFTVELNQTGTGTVNIDSTTDTSSIFDLVSSLDSAAQAVISNIQKVIDALSKMETTADGLNKLADALTKITETRAKITTIATTLSTFSSRIDSIRRSLDRIPTGTKSLSVKFNYSTSKSSAKGNVALAKGAEQPALAKGIPTLMGELGPELVVSQGHYFVVGQTGAEFVNLDRDAIVFNHKQTKRLFQNGSIGSRGTPFTNEKNALSFAKGNYKWFGPARDAIDEEGNVDTSQKNVETQASTIIKTKTITEKINNVRVSPTSHTIPLYSYAKGNAGPAMASASAALAQLKQIRAMWQSMLDASAKELGSLAGGSGGGKKGGGGGGDDWQQKTTNAEIQRWYNLIRQIAKLEEDITYQESLQAKLMSDRVANGKAVYKSYKQELALLQQEIGANQELAALQKSWYDAKRADLAASDYGKIFTYDENGLQQYVGTGAPGTGLGLDILENLTRQDVYGQAIGNAATAEAQLAYLRSVGFNTENLRYNEDGTLIKFEELEGEELDNAYVQMMENFWSNLDGWRDELDSIYDSYHEQLEKVLSNQDKQNEIFQKIVDNQLSVENDVLEALEAREQKRIDDAQDERDALSESADKFLKGLTDQLSKEREMYQRNSDQDDLNKLRRQLAILQRSGGAASQIRSLQDQINSKTQDAYFTAQQDQIDAIKEASDAQLERLDTQIDLMTETLEYQKENGLLWAEVYEVMARTPAEIQDFIINNTPDFQSNSALQVAEDVRDLKLRIEQWTEYRDDVNSGNNPMTTYSNTWDTFYNSQKNLFGNIDSATLKKAKNKYESTLAETGDPNEAAQAADKILNQYRKVNASAISNMSSAGSPSAGLYNGSGVNSGVGGAASVNEKVSTIEGMLRKGDKGDDVRKLQAVLNKLGYTDGSGNTLAEDGIFGSNTKAALEKFQSAMGIAADGILGPDTKGKFALKGYSRGGIADYTGLAMLHGTPENPEGILNANQMKMWKQDMDMREQLLPTLLATYNNMLQNNSNRNFGTTENTGTVIEHIDLNLNVQELSNDYDARRAADTIMERLMDVSRKSGSISIKRR